MRHHRTVPFVGTLTTALLVAACVSHSAAPVAQAPAPAPPAAATSAPPPKPDAMAGHDMAGMNMSDHDMAGMNMSGSTMDMPAMNMSNLPATAGDGYTVTDVHFMQDMIGHHSQAIVMSGYAVSHGASPDIQKLANKIAISQRDEIVFMKRWLTERHQVVPTDSQAAAMYMPGMLTPAQMKSLAAAHGVEYDRQFLTGMIGHHQGALRMVKELFDAPPAGQDPEIFRFATDVDTDQRAEIFVMNELLDRIH